MNLQDQQTLANYRKESDLNAEHGIFLVRDIYTDQLYVEKILTIYNKELYLHLKKHPIDYIPQIIEVIEDDNVLIIIEEYINGITLQQLLDQQQTLDYQQVRDIACQLCDILKQLHSQNQVIIHRDIKPSNIILRCEKVWLIDFNAAKFANEAQGQDTQLLGTSGFAAPEQYGFQPSSPQSDIYALGILMNVMLTGQLPSQQLATGPMQKVIRECTYMDPKYRYRTVDKVKKDLSSRVIPYLLPGFRSFNPLHMIIAITGYILLIAIAFNMFPDGEFTSLRKNMYSFINFAGFFSIVLFSCNYLNVHQLLGISQIKNPFVKTLAVIITDLGILAITVIVVLTI